MEPSPPIRNDLNGRDFNHTQITSNYMFMTLLLPIPDLVVNINIAGMA